MSDKDRIRVWNEDTGEMMVPTTIRDLMNMERTIFVETERVLTNEDMRNIDEMYERLEFMRNTGIYDHQSEVEIFAEDLITHASEPWVYRVAQKCGCWWALSLRPEVVPARLLNSVYAPRIVGNVFEDRELVLKGEVDHASA